MFELRKDQKPQVEFLLNAKQNSVVQSPTGSGKSVVMQHFVSRQLDEGLRGAIIVPNERLCHNFYKYFPDKATILYSGCTPDLQKQILITTNLSAKKALKAFKPDYFLHDECHHAPAATNKKLIEEWEERPHHGLTATTNRLDGKGLYPLFRNMYQSNQIDWYIRQGFLSDYQLKIIECPYFQTQSSTDDLRNQNTVFGSLPEVKKTVDIWIDECFDESSLFFCTTIEHAIALQTEFRRRGIKAYTITSDTSQSDREVIFNMFESGRLKILINIQIFTEGVDCPNIKNIFLCRFTYSTALYLQMVGRLLRKSSHPTKKIFDLAGNAYYHGSPKAFFEWDLHGQKVREDSNKVSLNCKCPQCEADLIPKRLLKHPTELCCLQCRTISAHLPTQKREKVGLEERYKHFTLADLNEVDPELVTGFTRILSDRKLKPEQKLSKVVNYEGIPKLVKKRALISLGSIKMDLINMFLED